MRSLLLRTLVVCVALLATVTVHAHDDQPRPTVDVTVTPNGSALVINARLPIAALMEANLPRTSDRKLDPVAAMAPLQLVARDIAARFDVSQNGEPLPFPTVVATLTPDLSAAEMVLQYVIQPGGAPLSARLRAFRSIPEAVPTRARFVLPGESGGREFLATGAPELVVFNPTFGQTLRLFAERGARLVVEGWAMFLFLLALIFPARGAGLQRRYVASLLGTQAITAAIAAAIGVSAAVVPIGMGIAASAIVLATLIGTVRPQSPWMTPLIVVFGVGNGIAVGASLVAASPYAGDHALVAFSALVVTAALGQLWLALLLSAVRDVAVRRGLPARGAALAVLVYACHGALHLLLDQTTLASAATTWSVEHLLTALVLAWAAVSLAAGVAATRSRTLTT